MTTPHRVTATVLIHYLLGVFNVCEVRRTGSNEKCKDQKVCKTTESLFEIHPAVST